MNLIKKGILYTGALLLSVVYKVYLFVLDMFYFVGQAIKFMWNNGKMVFKGVDLSTLWPSIALTISSIPVALSTARQKLKQRSSKRRNLFDMLAIENTYSNIFEWSIVHLA